PPSVSIGRYTRGCEFHSAIDGSGQLNGRSARCTSYWRWALACRGWGWVAVMSARGGESRDILARGRGWEFCGGGPFPCEGRSGWASARIGVLVVGRWGLVVDGGALRAEGSRHRLP